MRQKTLILVYSPLQALCAIEAINKFQICEYDIKIVGGREMLSKNLGVFRLLDCWGFKYEILYLKNIFEIFKYVLLRQNIYVKAIIGDYVHSGLLLFAILQMRKNGSIIYVDDGNSTYGIVTGKVCYPKVKDRIFRFVIVMMQRFKQINNMCFFTYFDVISERWSIQKNNFDYLSKALTTKRIKNSGVYIIGTNSQILEGFLANITYLEFLKKALSYVRQNFPEQLIYYCPHRADRENIEINNYLNLNGIQIFDTKVSVEYDFIMNDIRPVCILGFASSALYSLHMIFQMSEVYTIKLPLMNKQLSDEYTKIECDYKKVGIKVLEFLDH